MFQSRNRNITGWKSNAGATSTYTYSETGYTNPHAVTDIGGTTGYVYDNLGNMTVAGGWLYTPDYRNRLTIAVLDEEITHTYAYDDQNQRVKKVKHDGFTTYYPNKYYNITPIPSPTPSPSPKPTITKHVFSNDGTLLGTIEGNGAATTTNYIHTDHLGGTNVITSSTSTAVETTDYYPFGTQRIHTGTFTEQRKFTGHEYDTENDLTYANARYYEQDIGRFISQDPASRDNPSQFLLDPQQFNSYSYARNNPMVLVDRSGNASTFAWVVNPIGTAMQVTAFRASALAARLGAFGGARPATADLLEHAASLNPKDVYAGNGSSVVNAIQGAPEYRSAIDSFVQAAISEGKYSKTDRAQLEFNSGDAQTSIGKITLSVSGQQNKDGSWNISASGSDVYDFAPSNYKEGRLVGTAANLGTFGQRAESLTPFTTHVQFEQTYKPDNSNKKDD